MREMLKFISWFDAIFYFILYFNNCSKLYLRINFFLHRPFKIVCILFQRSNLSFLSSLISPGCKPCLNFSLRVFSLQHTEYKLGNCVHRISHRWTGRGGGIVCLPNSNHLHCIGGITGGGRNSPRGRRGGCLCIKCNICMRINLYEFLGNILFKSS